jgi:hypothetical protein
MEKRAMIKGILAQETKCVSLSEIKSGLTRITGAHDPNAVAGIGILGHDPNAVAGIGFLGLKKLPFPGSTRRSTKRGVYKNE